MFSSDIVFISFQYKLVGNDIREHEMWIISRGSSNKCGCFKCSRISKWTGLVSRMAGDCMDLPENIFWLSLFEC